MTLAKSILQPDTVSPPLPRVGGIRCARPLDLNQGCVRFFQECAKTFESVTNSEEEIGVVMHQAEATARG
jgi:hypothetical protein